MVHSPSSDKDRGSETGGRHEIPTGAVRTTKGRCGSSVWRKDLFDLSARKPPEQVRFKLDPEGGLRVSEGARQSGAGKSRLGEGLGNVKGL